MRIPKILPAILLLGSLLAASGCGGGAEGPPANSPPIAAFTVTPASGTTSTAFEFDASGSTDPEDPTTALEVRWDWESDGTFDTAWTTTKTSTHQYSTGGTKTITLEVRDTGGLTDVTTRSLALPLWSQPVFIINAVGQTLSVYDRANGSIHQDAATLGLYPNFFAIREGLIYVVNSGDNNVQLLNSNDLSPAGTIELGVGNNPMQIAFSGQKGYVSNLFTNTVSVIDLTTGQVGTPIPVGNGPTPIAVVGGKVFVGNTNYDFAAGGFQQGTVSLINPATDQVTNTIPVGTNPSAMAVDGSGRLHVVCTGDYASVTGEVWVIDPDTEQVVGEPVALGGFPTAISISPDNTAYVIATSYLEPSARGLMVYDAQTFEIIHSISNIVPVGTNPAGVAAADGYAYITDFDEDSLYSYRALTGEVANLGVVGDAPQFVGAP